MLTLLMKVVVLCQFSPGMPPRLVLQSKLLQSVGEGDLQGVRNALRRGADPNGYEPTALAYGSKLPPIALSMFHHGPKIAAVLLNSGARPDLAFVPRGKKRGRTALMFATRFDEPECVSLLLAHGASLKIRDDEGESAYDMAIKFRLDRILKIMSKYKH